MNVIDPETEKLISLVSVQSTAQKNSSDKIPEHSNFYIVPQILLAGKNSKGELFPDHNCICQELN